MMAQDRQTPGPSDVAREGSENNNALGPRQFNSELAKVRAMHVSHANCH